METFLWFMSGTLLLNKNYNDTTYIFLIIHFYLITESNKPSHAEVKVPPLHVSASSPRLRRDSHPLQHADSLQVPNAKGMIPSL